MKILVIGSGGREHALVWKLSQSREVSQIWAVPGNGGISDLAQCVEMDLSDIAGLIEFSRTKKIDLVVVGPENPLANGIVDAFKERGIPIFGPRRKGALIEASKIFAKELMRKNGIPTADFETFADYDKAQAYLDKLQAPFVLKADGLCAGKGVYVIKEKAEAEGVLKKLMVEGLYGEAGRNVVFEKFLSGIEASYLAFTDGTSILPMLPAQDHKPLLDGDKGPNTGGMGAYTPIPFISKELEQEIRESIMLRTIKALAANGVTYEGVLYGGLMLSDGHPYVIEFNARLGDPETQPILFKMKSDITPILTACVEGRLGSLTQIEWKEGVSICVVIASKGYPEKPEKGRLIKGLDRLKEDDNIMVFHAGTKKVDGQYYTSGGRVLCVTALDKTHEEAMDRVYEAVSKIEFEGMQFRSDIGKKALFMPYL
ncbi:MAG TPA: phosphoribosylamine--glycine ligase [Syntrophorhabdaceae bacterium]|nr:phosphoribosylamine--glycine ligase [Syntrophorhabdaceae bacterium]